MHMIGICCRDIELHIALVLFKKCTYISTLYFVIVTNNYVNTANNYVMQITRYNKRQIIT